MTIARRSRLVLALALVTAGLSSACSGDDDDIVTVVPPLVIRDTYPADMVLGFFGEEELSVNFDRAPGTGNVLMELYPAPAQLGSYGPTGSGRNWTWAGANFVVDDGAYAWLIDASLLARPLVVHFASGDRASLDGFEGTVASPNYNLVQPEGTVVFVLPFDTPFNPLDPASFLEAEPFALSASVAIDSQPLVNDPAIYRCNFLEVDRSYYVVGVKDTNDDLIYDPTSDWWGYHQSTTSNAPGIVVAKKWDDLDYRRNVALTLRPPAGLARASAGTE